MTDKHQLAAPSTTLVRRHIVDFDSERSYSAPDRALSALFKTYPLNSNLEEVLVKVSALNSLSSTNIYGIVDADKHIQAIEAAPHLEGPRDVGPALITAG